MSAQVKAAAKLRGAARTAQVEIKVRDAMETIQSKIKENGGIYPNNGGAVSMNEVARIANISQTTLFSPKQKALGQKVKAWVESLKQKEVVGRMRVQRTAHERAEDWRKKCIDMQNAFVGTELELQDARALLEQAKEQLDKLRSENFTLHRQLELTGKSKVTLMKKKDD
ncbi:hypothetical protein NC77_17170 [Janthinobacterium lividum]|uniref:hypothetical protein n=1 Tax=Janthinobacterium lividum TaxID=29581 RepID=UPI000538FA4D|nr:hypothetical protein [Janthinobacterium lividum]KHA77547.1 hypothetical protein NC77_17170 [Janthinobacterium lividum]